jgi:hypothetical protein
MSFINSFFAIYTGVFTTLYTYSIINEFNSLHKKIDILNNNYEELRKDTREIKDSYKGFKK